MVIILLLHIKEMVVEEEVVQVQQVLTLIQEQLLGVEEMVEQVLQIVFQEVQ
jgi:hypothetical protein